MPCAPIRGDRMITVYASFDYPGMSLAEMILNHDKAQKLIYEYADDYIAVKTELVRGVYKGKGERTLCFNVTSMDKAVKIAEVFRVEFNQECVLAVYHGSCFLIYPDNLSEYIGEWTEVSRDYAEKQDAYTMYPLTGKYYVAM